MKITALLLIATASCCFDGQTRCPGFKSTPYLTDKKTQFGGLIEGAGVDAAGNIYAVNFGKNTTTNILGRVYPKQQRFYTDNTPKAFLNAIRFLNPTTAFAADAANHAILKLTIAPNQRVTASKPFCKDKRMLQPNDFVISSIGSIFTSGMKYAADNTKKDGDIWFCSPEGEARRLTRLGRTNGIELSPDQKHLYVSEALNRAHTPDYQKIWRYNVNIRTGRLSRKTMWVDFAKYNTAHIDVDGMRADKYGNLFVTRTGNRQVQVFNPRARNIANITTSFPKPSNLDFGTKAGSTLFIVGQCPEYSTYGEGKGCVDRIRLETQGAGFLRIQKKTPAKRKRRGRK